MKYDATIKDLFPNTPALFQLLTGSTVVETLNVEFSSVQQRRADLVAKLASQEILHLEIQSDNDEEMLWRELEYCLAILRTYQQMPRQVVLYLGKAPPTFLTQITYARLTFSYQLVNLQELDGSSLFQSAELGDNLLALLTDLPNPTLAVRQVMTKIAPLDSNQRSDLLKKLAILAGLRPLQLPRLIQQEAKFMSITLELEDNPLFQEIFQRYQQRGEQRGLQLGEQRGLQLGEQRGQRALLQRLLEKRFGTLPDWARQHVEQANSTQLEEWSLRVLEASELKQVFLP
jgi:predicted transposase YdaD